MTTYALDTGQPGTYRTFDNYVSAVLAAYDAALRGDTATVVQVDGAANDLTFKPLVTTRPPITPPSTSPRGTA